MKVLIFFFVLIFNAFSEDLYYMDRFVKVNFYTEKYTEKNFYFGINYSRSNYGYTFERDKIKSSINENTVGKLRGWRSSEYFEGFFVNFMYFINFDKYIIAPEIKQYIGYSSDSFGKMTILHINFGRYLSDNIIFLFGVGSSREKANIYSGIYTYNNYQWNFSFEPKILYKINDDFLFSIGFRIDRNIKTYDKFIKYDKTNYFFGIIKNF